MRRFVVEVDRCGGMNVIDEYGRETGLLTLGEMLEQMVSLCHRSLDGKPQFGMLTPQEWDARAVAREVARLERAGLIAPTSPALQ